jgi:hypothetical protein
LINNDPIQGNQNPKWIRIIVIFCLRFNHNPFLPLFQFLVEEEDVLEDVVLEEMFLEEIGQWPRVARNLQSNP